MHEKVKNFLSISLSLRLEENLNEDYRRENLDYPKQWRVFQHRPKMDTLCETNRKRYRCIPKSCYKMKRLRKGILYKCRQLDPQSFAMIWRNLKMIMTNEPDYDNDAIKGERKGKRDGGDFSWMMLTWKGCWKRESLNGIGFKFRDVIKLLLGGGE